MQEAFPRMRPDIVAEQRLIIAAVQPILAAILLIGPAGGQIGYALDIIIHDGLVAQRRADDTKPVTTQRTNEAVKPVGRDDGLLLVLHVPGPALCNVALSLGWHKLPRLPNL